MKRSLHVAAGFFATLGVSGFAKAVDIEPLHVSLSIRGKRLPFGGDCEAPTTEPPPVPGAEQPTPPPVPVPPPGPIDPPRGGSAGLCVRPVEEPVAYADVRDVVTASTQYSQALQQSVQTFTNFEGVLKDMTAANELAGAARSTALQALAPRYETFVQQFYRLSEASRVQVERFTLCTNTLPEWMKELKTRY